MNNKDTVKQFRHGQKLISTTAVQFIPETFKFTKGILIRSAGANDPTPNTDVVWIGGSGVSENDGMPIAPGESLTVPFEDGRSLYAISTSANQSIAWLGA
jgi:hypothetical protein